MTNFVEPRRPSVKQLQPSLIRKTLMLSEKIVIYQNINFLGLFVPSLVTPLELLGGI